MAANGLVTTQFGPSDNSGAGSVLIQPDSRIVLVGGGGPGFQLARYLPNGALDGTFRSGGLVSTHSGSYGVAAALLGNGEILVAGSQIHYGPGQQEQDATILARYNCDGSLDASFGVNGIVTNRLSGGFNHILTDLLVQADDKILTSGRFATLPDGGFGSVMRFNADGTPDTTFGNLGTGIFTNAPALGLATQADSRILVAMDTTVPFQTCLYDHAIVSRLNGNDGSLDLSFDGTGTAIAEFTASEDDQAMAAAVQADGKVVAAGSSAECTSGFALARYHTDGSLDGTFGEGGRTFTDAFGFPSSFLNISIQDISLQSDGRILAAGDTGFIGGNSLSSNAFIVAKYVTNGQLDATFGTGGVVVTQLIRESRSDTGQVLNRVFSQSDGTILVAGTTYFGCSGDPTCFAEADVTLVNYNSDGSLNTTFGSDQTGIVYTSFGSNAIGTLLDAGVRSDGRIVALVNSFDPTSLQSAAYLLRYTTNGVPDATFGSNGVVGLMPGVSGTAYLRIQPDNKVVVAPTR